MKERKDTQDLRRRLADLPSASPLRRFGAMVYDGLLVIAMMLTTTGLLNLFAPRPLIPEGAEVVSIEQMETISGPLLTSILFIQTFLFFAFFWMRYGRTLGMQAWRLRVISDDGLPITAMQSLKRFLAAIPSLGLLGAGYLWFWLDPARLTWPDRLSGSRIVRVPDDLT
ncbi:MAG TPA: RDD family protein [Pseudomonadales bacterium]|nr:RDD family protein [Pseudomonadales bacterium]